MSTNSSSSSAFHELELVTKAGAIVVVVVGGGVFNVMLTVN